MNTEVQVLTDSNTVTVYEGKALELRHPIKVELEGDINAVAAFVGKRYNSQHDYSNEPTKTEELQEIDRDRAIVLVDENAMVIKLLLEPQNPFGTIITGKLEFTNDVKQFKINEPETFTREQLIKLLRFNRRLFTDFEKYDVLLKSYQTLQIKTSAELKQDSDNRGNKAMNFQKAVNSDSIPTEFILKVPVFKGQPEEVFRVEICLDATDASVRFWFESVELAELIEVRKKEIFAAQLEACQDFVIIHK